MTDATHFRWTSSSRSHVGLIREINEDSFLDRPERGMWAVADGMGGHSLGDYASRMVVARLDDIPYPGDLKNFLIEAKNRLQSANHDLRQEAIVRDVYIIGSTAVVLLAWESECGYLWAGDSRIYRYRQGELQLLTRDHSQVEELKARAGLSDEEAQQHATRNMITRAVGAADMLEIDENVVQVDDGDMFLLCSDGLSNAVSEQEMRNALSVGDCGQASETLINMALNGGGRDNISAVVVRVDDDRRGDMTALNPAL
ncbi:PP2C family protein-serine/threonine phosphatase [Noviherbaspirillum saxi]|uniref:Serine/threonine-protein phosphatase n=1 Tax=Noviherbaspirillum saxi TaxID=2320863 RepID=A0A3A3FKK7_9BURK|nr:protein phosphatase 2C domain-containing protein [Noviherbaspirillum saxi]RJF96058.1 serine/threonine-protein phosphatase [Noviherbaspirillum saxi]